MRKKLSPLLQLTSLIFALCIIGAPTAKADVVDQVLAGMEQQSPIDIRSDNTYFGRLSPLQFNLSSDTNLSVINNGSPAVDKTIRANVVPGAGSVTVDGDTYKLAQFHFHEPSEHLENAKPAAMELHLVFADASNNVLVVGRLVNEGSFNSALGPIFSDLPQNTSTTHTVDHFNLNSLLPDNLESFRYTGSLTTPPFTEGVKWVNLYQPIEMSKEQIQAFGGLFPEGNAREVQPLNGRIILTDVPGFVSTSPVPEPETYAMLLAGLGLIGFIASCRGRQSTEVGNLRV